MRDLMPLKEIYMLGQDYSLWLFLGIAVITTLGLLLVSIRFAYFYFIKTGDLFIFSVDKHYHHQVSEVLREKNYVLDMGIGQVWLAGGFLTLLAYAATYVWPLVVFALLTLGLPLGLIYVLAYNRRKKEVFVQRLSGNTSEA